MNALEVGSRSSAYLLEVMGSFSSVFHRSVSTVLSELTGRRIPLAQLDARSTKRL